MVFAVVSCELIGSSLKSDDSCRDPVCVSTDDCTETRMLVQIPFQVVEAEDHITHFSLPIGHHERDQDATVVRDPGLQTVHVPQGIQIYFCANGCYPERFLHGVSPF